MGLATSVAALGSILATRQKGTAGAAREGAFVSGLDELLLISALIAIVGGALALALIRRRDFVGHAQAEGEAAPRGEAVAQGTVGAR